MDWHLARIGRAGEEIAPVAAHHDGKTLTALIADENGAWVERRTGDDPQELAEQLLALVP